jgi:DNA (cytosine-5)-methyltransferase 1
MPELMGGVPLALDLFCGAGGASMGLHQAGFEVIGVDQEPQPSYPFRFVQGELFSGHWGSAAGVQLLLERAGLVWASPPCQAFTAYRRRPSHVRSRPNLIPATRELLQRAGRPYIIENVPGAREHLRLPIQLCGSSFGLDVRRHRLFETSFPVLAPPCNHSWQTPRFPPATNRTNPRCTVEVGVWRIPLAVQQRAMGIDWMELTELSQAIPPAYSRWLAEQYLATERAAG